MQPVGATPLAAPPRPAPRVLHRDPAPSRMRYKLARLWLTPSVRGLLRIGLPLALILGVLGALVGRCGAARCVSRAVYNAEDRNSKPTRVFGDAAAH